MASLKLLFLALLSVFFFPASSSTLLNAEKLKSWFVVLSGGAELSPSPKWITDFNTLAFFLVFAVTAYFLFKVWNLLFVPIKLFRSLGDTGYIPDGERAMKDVAYEVKRRRRTGDLPPVFPNGWFHILNSWEVGALEVKFLACLGEHLAVFRGEDGVVHIVDAYCPHLGANLAIGGQVVGNCIQCPFHGWQFHGGDGKCTKIPYSKSIPAIAKIKSWPCMERNDLIMLWYHAEGTQPTWIPEQVDEIQSGKWVYRGRTTHKINAHIQEIPENGADINHLEHLHGSPILAGTDLRYTFTSKWLEVMRHVWDGTWSVDENNKHVGKLTLKHEIVIFGFRLPLLDFYLCAKQTGPGIVHMHFSSILGDGIMIHTVTPEEPLMQRVEHKIYGSRFMPTIIAKFYLYAESIQIERDIMIWNHKRYEAKPLLVKEDHLINKHRRWYSQFYSENSPRYPVVENNTLEW